MFLINDLTARRAKIDSFLEKDPAVAVLLAAADFEWTVRRAILALGSSPTKYIRGQVLGRRAGIDHYKHCWNEEVKPRLQVGLAQIVKNPDWHFFRKQAYPLRDRLIHGVSGKPGADYARRRAKAILGVSKALTDFAEKQGEPIYGRRIRRLKPRV